MSFLEQNLAVLAKSQPELARRIAEAQPPEGAELGPSRAGAPFLRMGGVLFCSSVDPEAEGRRLAADAPAGPLAVLGFGLGYHLEPLAGRDLLVWEPELGLLRLALEARDLTHLLPRMRLVTSRRELAAATGRAVILHPPSARLYPDQARLLQRSTAPAARAPRPAKPRVLVVPPVYGGSLPLATWCAEALSALGCRVRRPPLEAVEPLYRQVRGSELPAKRTGRAVDLLLGFLGQAVLLAAEEFKPHLVLALAQAPLPAEVVDRLSRLGAVTAFWFVEDFRMRPYFREVAAAYDHFFHIQGRAMEAQLRGLGANGHHLPLAAHPPVHRPLELSEPEAERWGARVGFMGEGYPNRVRILGSLAGRIEGLRVWGTGWPDQGRLARLVGEDGRRLEPEEVVRVYNACQVVLNLPSSDRASADPSAMDFVNPRTFEVAACGGFQLVQRSSALARVLLPEVDVAVFNDEGELAGLIEHYLAHPQQRSDVAAAGRRRVLTEHTYYHRMDHLLAVCLGPGPEEGPPAGENQEALDLMLEHLASER